MDLGQSPLLPDVRCKGRHRLRSKLGCRGQQPDRHDEAWLGADVDVLLAVFGLAVRGGLPRPAAALLLVLRAPLVRLDLADNGQTLSAGLPPPPPPPPAR